MRVGGTAIPLTDTERVSVRHHLGYINVGAGPSTGPAFQTVNTTSPGAIGTGIQTVTPASMVNIALSQLLVVDIGANQETVAVVGLSATTFAAVFSKGHAGGVAIVNKPLVGFNASLLLSIPRPVETLFVLELSMNQILEVALPRVRQTLSILDSIEQKMVDSLDRLAVSELEEIKLRPTIEGQTEQDALHRNYVYWAGILADEFGVPYYPYSARFKDAPGQRSGNVRVRRI